MSSCTWEEFPDEPAVLQKPVALSFATAVETAPEADTRVIRPGTDFGRNAYFPVGKYAIGIHLYNLNGSEVFEGSDNMQGLMEITGTGTGTGTGTDNDEWKYWNSQGTPVTPKGFPGTRIRRMAYTPYDPKATIDSIPFDFTNKVNVEPQYGQANLLLCSTGETDIPADPLANPIQLRFKNAYTKVVLRITKKEDKNDNQNIGKVTETAIDNLTAEWIKNRGGIDPATGYVKPTSEPGKIWNDSTAMLTTIEPVEFTFLVPAFMDKDVKDDNFGFVLQIDGQQRLFPLKKSQLNTGADAGRNALVVPTPHDRHEAFVIPSDICFAASACDPRRLGIDVTGAWAVAANALSYDYLWNEIRVKGGAYGCGFRAAGASGGVLHLPRPGNRPLD